MARAAIIAVPLALLLHGDVAGAVSLRLRGPRAKRGCTPLKPSSLLQAPVFYDGYSRMGCDVDVSPEKVRVSFKEHACGDVASCRLLTLPMEPRLCFDFCRTQETAKFFGIRNGRECYCTTYFHPKSTGGQGECSVHCEGNQEEMCGGPEKSSLFEMHMCGDSADEADMALESSAEALAKTMVASDSANQTALALRDLAGIWSQLGVCSVAPEGQQVCALTKGWLADAADLSKAGADAQHAGQVLQKEAKVIDEFKAAAAADGAAANSSVLSSMELATENARKLSSKAMGAAAGVNTTLEQIAGPVGGRELASFEKVFKPLGDVEANWHGICGLVPIEGQAYAALAAKGAEAACADKCLSLSTGTKACVAFNFQYKGGLAACQMLTEEGLLEPADSIAKTVPIFEVSATKATSMGLDSLGCYAKTGFLGGHPKGPLKTTVVREVTA